MHITRQGECWDEASKEVYGDEKYVGYLMQNNFPLLDTMVFSAGTQLNTPELPAEEADMAPWRKQA